MENEIRKACVFLRENNNTIPSEVIEFMKIASLEKLEEVKRLHQILESQDKGYIDSASEEEMDDLVKQREMNHEEYMERFKEEWDKLNDEIKDQPKIIPEESEVVLHQLKGGYLIKHSQEFCPETKNPCEHGCTGLCKERC